MPTFYNTNFNNPMPVIQDCDGRRPHTAAAAQAILAAATDKRAAALQLLEVPWDDKLGFVAILSPHTAADVDVGQLLIRISTGIAFTVFPFTFLYLDWRSLSVV